MGKEDREVRGKGKEDREVRGKGAGIELITKFSSGLSRHLVKLLLTPHTHISFSYI